MVVLKIRYGTQTWWKVENVKKSDGCKNEFSRRNVRCSERMTLEIKKRFENVN